MEILTNFLGGVKGLIFNVDDESDSYLDEYKKTDEHKKPDGHSSYTHIDLNNNNNNSSYFDSSEDSDDDDNDDSDLTIDQCIHNSFNIKYVTTFQLIKDKLYLRYLMDVKDSWIYKLTGIYIEPGNNEIIYDRPQKFDESIFKHDESLIRQSIKNCFTETIHGIDTLKTCFEINKTVYNTIKLSIIILILSKEVILYDKSNLIKKYKKRLKKCPLCYSLDSLLSDECPLGEIYYTIVNESDDKYHSSYFNKVKYNIPIEIMLVLFGDVIKDNSKWYILK